MNPESAFEAYKDQIQRYLTTLVQDPVQAEDLLQETFLRAHRHRESLKDPAALKAWLYQIATRVCYDHFRRSASPVVSPLLAPEFDRLMESSSLNQAEPGVESLVERVEMSRCVQGIIHQLPETYRLVILLHDVHGLTNSETAQVLGCSLDAAKSHLHRGRLKLKEALLKVCEFSRDERGVFVCQPKTPARR
jgi:RNA polymerase sigma-70 factor (ECF subfamily)